MTRRCINHPDLLLCCLPSQAADPLPLTILFRSFPGPPVSPRVPDTPPQAQSTSGYETDGFRDQVNSPPGPLSAGPLTERGNKNQLPPLPHPVNHRAVKTGWSGALQTASHPTRSMASTGPQQPATRGQPLWTRLTRGWRRHDSSHGRPAGKWLSQDLNPGPSLSGAHCFCHVKDSRRSPQM